MTAIRLRDDMSEAEKTAIRRGLNAAEVAPVTVELVTPARGETVRDVILAFQRGDEDLHGFPRHLVDFDALLAALERAER